MKTIENIVPKFATHPGSILVDEIDANNYSQIEFAKFIGYKRSQLNEIIKGKRNITAELSLLLEKALGIDASFWLEAQKNYDLDKARIEAKNRMRLEAIEIWNLIRSIVPYTFLKKEKILIGDPCIDNNTIKEIYGSNNIEELVAMKAQPNFARFRKSTKLKSDVSNIIGWDRLVKYKASSIKVSEFKIENKEYLIKNLRDLFFENKNVLERAQTILHENGIKLIYQAKGEKTPIDGVSFWSGENPAIGMTLRYKRLDNFAFTLFHELGHVYEHLTKNNQAEFIDLDAKNEVDEYKYSPEEIEANQFAQSQLINKSDWDKFKNDNLFLTNDHLIIDFANQIKLHPSIIRGRICYELNDYKSHTQIDHSIN